MGAQRYIKIAYQEPTAWRRGMGALVCVLAILTALLGQMEHSSAAVNEVDALRVALHHIDSPSNDEGALSSQHCMHPSHCTVQAVFPAAPSIDPGCANALWPAAEWFGSDQIGVPLRPPPKIP